MADEGAYWLGVLGAALAAPAATERAARLCEAESDDQVGGPLARRIRTTPVRLEHEWIWDDTQPEGASMFCTRCYRDRDFRVDEADEPACVAD